MSAQPPLDQRLLDAAAELLAERGFGRATVQEIATRAGCAAGTLYNHFADKDALLVGLVERLGKLEAAKVGLGDAAAADFRGFVAAWIAQRTGTLAANEDLLRGLLGEMLVRPDLRARYTDAVLGPRLESGTRYLERVAERGDAAGPDPELVSRVLLGAVLGLVLLRMLGEPTTRARWDETCTALADVLLDGLGPRPFPGAASSQPV